MIDIFNTVESIYKRNYIEKEDKFKEGFEECLALFETGIFKSVRYNLTIRNHQLEHENKDKDKRIRNLNTEIKRIQEKLNKKVLVDAKPLALYSEFAVTCPFGELKIVTNMEKSTFEFCLMNFALRYKYTTVDECKSKILQYINSYSSRGFRAFKSKETAIKEGVKLERK
jgi:hypothetical protein